MLTDKSLCKLGYVLDKGASLSLPPAVLVYIYTLPLYLWSEVNSERYTCYRIISCHDIAMPMHFTNILVVEGKEQKTILQSILNERLTYER